MVTANALLGVVEVDPVGAGIGQEIAAILIVDGAVATGQDSLWILQDPLILRRPADADRPVIKCLGGFLTRGKPLKAGNGQSQGHDAISGGELFFSTLSFSLYRSKIAAARMKGKAKGTTKAEYAAY